MEGDVRMTDWSRLIDYIHNYFPDPSHSSQDIRDWAIKEVPAWKGMSNSDKNAIIKDWENFITPQVQTWFKRMTSGFRDRIRKFLGRSY